MNQYLKEAITEDNEYYYGGGVKRIYRVITHNPLYQRGKYIQPKIKQQIHEILQGVGQQQWQFQGMAF